MKTAKQTVAPSVGVAGFKQAVVRLKGGLPGDDLAARLAHLNQWPVSIGGQLPLVDFDPFAATTLDAEMPAPPAVISPTESGVAPAAMAPDARLRVPLPAKSNGGRDGSVSNHLSHPPPIPDTDAPHEMFRGRSRPSAATTSPEKGPSGKFQEVQHHPTATGREAVRAHRPAGPIHTPLSTAGGEKVNAVTEPPPATSPASPGPYSSPEIPAHDQGSQRPPKRRLDPGAGLATTLRQLDALTHALLARDARSAPDDPMGGQARASSLHTAGSMPWPQTTRIPEPSVLPASPPFPGHPRFKGEGGRFSKASFSSTLPPSAQQGSAEMPSMEDGVNRTHGPVPPAPVQGRAAPTLALLSRLTADLTKRHRSTPAHPAGTDSMPPPSLPVLATASAAARPGMERTRRPVANGLAVSNSANHPTAIGQGVEFTPCGSHDPHLMAEQLTDLINDVLVSQARRHGVDV